MPTRTLSRTKAKKPVSRTKPPERKASARTVERERMREDVAESVRESTPAVLREPAPKPAVKSAAASFVYVNGERVAVDASTLAASLGVNVRHTDAGNTPVKADERVVHSMKYRAG